MSSGNTLGQWDRGRHFATMDADAIRSVRQKGVDHGRATAEDILITINDESGWVATGIPGDDGEEGLITAHSYKKNRHLFCEDDREILDRGGATRIRVALWSRGHVFAYLFPLRGKFIELSMVHEDDPESWSN
jgi:hypothetical protein